MNQVSPPLSRGTQDNYMSWRDHCLECSAIRKGGHGLFCGNYLLARGNYPPCGSVWCGECYRESPTPNDNFPRLDHLQSRSDLDVDAAYMQSCYRCGRNGDHLMGVPFECDLCSFQNVYPHSDQASALVCDVGTGARHSGFKLVGQSGISTWQ